MIVLTCGPAGSGKTVHARALEAQGFARLSFDEEAWRRGYSSYPVPQAVTQQIHDDLIGRVAALAAAGRHAVVETSFWSRKLRERYRAALREIGVEPVIHVLRVPLPELQERLATRRGTGPDDVVIAPDTLRRFVAEFEWPTAQEGPIVEISAPGQTGISA